ncbi:hypothetical protein [Williamsia muralis]|nr:hypothetical protein [Williamsia marianensis]
MDVEPHRQAPDAYGAVLEAVAVCEPVFEDSEHAYREVRGV